MLTPKHILVESPLSNYKIWNRDLESIIPLHITIIIETHNIYYCDSDKLEYDVIKLINEMQKLNDLCVIRCNEKMKNYYYIPKRCRREIDALFSNRG